MVKYYYVLYVGFEIETKTINSMTKKACVDENGMKKGAWSEEEDAKLRSYILRYGHWNWRLLPKFAGLARCGKSCRLRWMNYLKPGLKRGSFTKEEELLISKLHDELGKKWSAMAARLPGRSDNDIKNFWHTHLKKRSSKGKSKSIPSIASKNDANSELAKEVSEKHIIPEASGTLNSPNPGAVSWDSERSASSSQYEVEETYNVLSSQAQKFDSRSLSNIDDNNNTNNNNYYYGTGISLSDAFEASFWTEPFLVDTQESDRSFSPLMQPEEAALYLLT